MPEDDGLPKSAATLEAELSVLDGDISRASRYFERAREHLARFGPYRRGGVQDLKFQGVRAYYAWGDCVRYGGCLGEIEILDISGLVSPTLLGSYESPPGSRGPAIGVSGDYGYLGSRSQLMILNVYEPAAIEPREMPLAVVYQDRDCVVIDKPPGLVVHPATSHRQDTLVNALLAHYPEMARMVDPETETGVRPGIVHRLDHRELGRGHQRHPGAPSRPERPAAVRPRPPRASPPSAPRQPPPTSTQQSCERPW